MRSRERSIRTRSGVSLRWRNGRLYAAVRLKGFPNRYRSFPEGTTEDEAQEWGLEEARKLKLRDVPTLAHKALKEITLERLIRDYLRECDLAQLTNGFVQGYKLKRSHMNEAIALNSFLDREVGLCRKSLDQIDRQIFEDYRNRRLNSGVKPATLRRELNPIRHIYRLARRKYQISTDPFTDLILPKEDEGRKRIMSKEERSKILTATETCRGEKQGRLWRALILAALTTAARKGELLKLQWEDVDLEKRTLNFRAANTKSGKSRLIPMSKSLHRDLLAYREMISEKDKSSTSLVFKLTPTAHLQGWRRICTRAKIEDLHFHDLKHTALTSFASKPIELNTRESAYMGDHKEARIGSRYEHLEMVESIRAKLDIDHTEEESQKISEVTLPDAKRKISQGMAEYQKTLKEKVALFKVENNNTRLVPLGIYTRAGAYKLLDVENPEIELGDLEGYYKGAYAYKKHLIVDVKNMEEVLNGLIGKQAAQNMSARLKEITVSLQ